MGRRKGTSTGVRAKIARRKRMKDANALDNILGSLSDQEATSGAECYDEDDSVEEKQDSEPMNDWQSKKTKSPLQVNHETPRNSLMPPDMTPETARKNWNSRLARKLSFMA